MSSATQCAVTSNHASAGQRPATTSILQRFAPGTLGVIGIPLVVQLFEPVRRSVIAPDRLVTQQFEKLPQRSVRRAGANHAQYVLLFHRTQLWESGLIFLDAEAVQRRQRFAGDS